MLKKDMNDLMSEALQEVQKSGFIEKTMKKHVESTIENSIKDCFGGYSDFNNSLVKAIKEQIKIDFKKLSLGQYSTTITTMVRNIIKEKMSSNVQKEIERFLVSLESNDIPEELKITDMVHHIAELWQTEDDYGNKEKFEFSFHFKQDYPNDDVLKHLCTIYIDEEEDKEERKCNIKIDYDSKRQEIDNITISGISMKDNTVYTTSKWQVEGYLFQLYSNKSKLINDAEYVEPYLEGDFED